MNTNLLNSMGIYFSEENIQKKIVFLFPGQGSQYLGMIKDIANWTSVKKVLEKSDNLYLELTGKKLTAYIFGEKAGLLEDAEIMQPAVYTVNYVMFVLLKELGIRPDYLLGHSLGEFTALVAAEIISFEDGFHMVFQRAKSLNSLPVDKRGKMIGLKILRESDVLEKFLEESKRDGVEVEIALHNSPDQLVISGMNETISYVEDYCKKTGIIYNLLPVSHGFHSSILEAGRSEFERQLLASKFHFSPPKIDTYSSISQDWYSKEKKGYDSESFSTFLSNQLVNPFSFNQIIKEMHENFDATLFIEAGAGNILSRLVDEILEDGYCVIPTNVKKVNDYTCLKRTAAYLKIKNRKSEEI